MDEAEIITSAQMPQQFPSVNCTGFQGNAICFERFPHYRKYILLYLSHKSDVANKHPLHSTTVS